MSGAQDDIQRLIADEALPPDFAESVRSILEPIAQQIAERRATQLEMLVAGICGPQGSGKSTISAFLKLLLERMGKTAAVLSIDDLYLTHAERQRLGRDIHPLLATRGPPGTHDVAMGVNVVEALTRARPDTITKLPRFDKSVDDRAPEGEWQAVIGRPDVLLFEGWCVGAKPEPDDALLQPINRLERDKDGGGDWRRYVNTALTEDYRRLFAKIGLLVLLRPPGFETVAGWRSEQEDKLRKRSPAGTRLMSKGQIAEFIMHYERVTRRILAEMPARADIVVDIDKDHHLTGFHARSAGLR